MDNPMPMDPPVMSAVLFANSEVVDIAAVRGGGLLELSGDPATLRLSQRATSPADPERLPPARHIALFFCASKPILTTLCTMSVLQGLEPSKFFYYFEEISN